jgi:mannose-6-phosphate isomerase-like protein (cupin superfamily)
MKLLAVLVALAPLFAGDPAGFVVWRSAELKQHATTQELHYASDYQVVVVHQDRSGDAELNEFLAELLVIESGEATLLVGGKIRERSIEGGEKAVLSEGDVAHIPPNMAHQILVAPGKPVTYLLIRQRVDADADSAPGSDPTGKKPTLGADLGGGFRACVASDKSPSGTAVDGFRKVIGYNFMGQTCVWSPIDQSESTTGPSTAPSASKDKPRIGTDMGAGFRSCVAGDDSPNGTIFDGYRKELHPGPFGNSCAWVKIK